MDVLAVFLIIACILFFGYIAEFIFRKTHIPDVLLLIILGLSIGKYGFNFVSLGSLASVSPVFISFTLLFLLYDGAFKIDLASFTKEFGTSMSVMWFNYFASVLVITTVIALFGVDWRLALLAGFILGGISSAFVIPLLKQMNASKQAFSILTLESAFSDVVCIVLALTMMDLIQVGSFNIQTIISTIIALFAVAGLMGVVGAILWLFILTKVLKHEAMNMLTIAFLLVLYVSTEYLHGNGAIACLFFGIVLKNSLQLREILRTIAHPRTKVVPKKAVDNQKVGISLSLINEEEFYREIAFFIKTLFFVYIGILLDFSDIHAVTIGVACAIVILLVRPASRIVTGGMLENDRKLVSAVFGRGIAAAVIVQTAVQRGVPNAPFLSSVVMVVILGTIVFSSIRIFFYRTTPAPSTGKRSSS